MGTVWATKPMGAAATWRRWIRNCPPGKGDVDCTEISATVERVGITNLVLGSNCKAHGLTSAPRMCGDGLVQQLESGLNVLSHRTMLNTVEY